MSCVNNFNNFLWLMQTSAASSHLELVAEIKGGIRLSLIRSTIPFAQLMPSPGPSYASEQSKINVEIYEYEGRK